MSYSTQKKKGKPNKRELNTYTLEKEPFWQTGQERVDKERKKKVPQTAYNSSSNYFESDS